jgi:hypothetical protein
MHNLVSFVRECTRKPDWQLLQFISFGCKSLWHGPEDFLPSFNFFFNDTSSVVLNMLTMAHVEFRSNSPTPFYNLPWTVYDDNSAGQQNYLVLCKQSVHYRANKIPKLVPTQPLKNQSVVSHPISVRSILILSTCPLQPPGDIFPWGFPNVHFSSPHACYMSRLLNFPWLNHPNNRSLVQIMNFLVV